MKYRITQSRMSTMLTNPKKAERALTTFGHLSESEAIEARDFLMKDPKNKDKYFHMEPVR